MPYNLLKRALKKLFEMKGAVALVFLTVTLISGLLVALRYFLPTLLAFDLLSTDKKITSEFFIFAVLFVIISFLALTPLKIGIKRWFFKVANDEKLKFSEIFYFYKSKLFFKCIGLKILTFVKKIGTGLLIFSPNILLLISIIYVRQYLSEEAMLSFVILNFLFIILAVTQIWIFILLSSRYFLTEYLVSSLTVRESFKLSKELMAKRKKNMFFLYLSFLLFLPIIFLYSNMTLALYARKLTSKEQQNDKQSIRCQKNCR